MPQNEFDTEARDTVMQVGLSAAAGIATAGILESLYKESSAGQQADIRNQDAVKSLVELELRNEAIKSVYKDVDPDERHRQLISESMSQARESLPKQAAEISGPRSVETPKELFPQIKAHAMFASRNFVDLAILPGEELAAMSSMQHTIDFTKLPKYSIDKIASNISRDTLGLLESAGINTDIGSLRNKVAGIVGDYNSYDKSLPDALQRGTLRDFKIGERNFPQSLQETVSRRPYTILASLAATGLGFFGYEFAKKSNW